MLKKSGAYVSETGHNHNGDDHDHGAAQTAPPGAPSPLLVEIREHLPFSVTAVALGLITAGAICVLGSTFADALPAEGLPGHKGHADHIHGPEFAKLFFHLFHPAHMFFSAVATTAMFCRYDRNIVKALIVGIIGAVGVCGVSDVIMPHVSLMILGIKTPWHICVIEHPSMVLPFAGIGVVVGIAASGSVIRSTLISHSLHVLASSMASIFYMIGPLGMVAWIDRVGQMFLFVVLAVMVPCCLSDIIFPMLMTKPGRAKYAQEPHACH